jgi:selenophosphate synthase
VHYVVFNSTFVTPKVARSYELKRNGYIATVNVSVLDRMSNGKPAMDVAISGTAKNLVGQVKTLEFKQIKEGAAIYYLAQFPFANEETYNFTLNIDAGLKGKGPIKFSQKLYVEE